jgi:ribosome-binding factor A
LANLFRDELSDPDLSSARFAGAELSVDYRTVRVRFFTVVPFDEVERTAVHAERALERAAGFLRHRLDEALELKRVPEVRFVHDRDAGAAFRAAKLLDEEATDDSAKGGSA